ncbi:hypothetical protein ACQ5SO_12610 [Rhodovulum sp. DZ06]|uniref:hypothetical protein n=1 Tax=Rhodovulum sp. DZ06 TaxID=3425126 RepID=UPI003D343C6D
MARPGRLTTGDQALQFIFMLTRDDRTVEDAEARLEDALAAGLTCIGFKDVGLPIPRLAALHRRIKAAGAISVLEVVSEDPAAELRSVRAGLEIGVNRILGGTSPRAAEALIAGAPSAPLYMPFPGRVTGSPSVLHGPQGDIVASAAEIAARPGVGGLDLLAWRFDGDVPALIAGVVRAAAGKPVVVAGSIDRPERVAAAKAAGAAGFTVGTAALDDAFAGAVGDLRARLAAIQAMAAG